MYLPSDSLLIVAFGDSITNGTGSTLDGYDRWTDILSARLHNAYGTKIAVVNAGIGGNQVLGPTPYSRVSPFPGGPSALQRLKRDVLSLSGLSTVIWTEGINDLAASDATPNAIIDGMKLGAAELRSHLPSVRIVGGTLTSALGSTGPHGTLEVDRKRKELNEKIRSADFFDAVIDFDKATTDATTGGLKDGLAVQDDIDGSGDRLHPNRAGYLAMASVVHLRSLMRTRRRHRTLKWRD
jgi:lysophospholipase L1-like esterase